MQCEVDRFRSSVQLTYDYYHAIEDKLIPEPPPAFYVDLLEAGEELPPVEEETTEGSGEYTYPRLDKIFSYALKA